jgi:hypothetical protein
MYWRVTNMGSMFVLILFVSFSDQAEKVSKEPLNVWFDDLVKYKLNVQVL